jgi:hypothetical protein
MYTVAKTESPRGVSSGWSKIRGGFAIPKGKRRREGEKGKRERERECVCVCVCVWMRAGERARVRECETEAAEVLGRWRPERETRTGDESKINRKKKHADRNGVRPRLSDLDEARRGGLYIRGR